MKVTFLKWLLQVSVMTVAMFVAASYGLFSTIVAADSTWISVGIMAWFVLATVRCGMASWKLSGTNSDSDDTISDLERFSFCSGAFTTLGMIGTVIGFIIALGAFNLIDSQNPASIQLVIKQLVNGVGPALYTTLTGLVCAFLLRFQAANLSLALKRHDDSGEVMS
jgi:hypothetical protein